MCRKVQCLCAGQAPGGSKILLYYDRKLVHTPQAVNVCDFNAFFMSFYPGSYDIRSFRSLFYRLWLFYRKPLHQPCVLFGCYLLRLGFVSRPLESAVIEPLVKQQKSIAFRRTKTTRPNKHQACSFAELCLQVRRSHGEGRCIRKR